MRRSGIARMLAGAALVAACAAARSRAQEAGDRGVVVDRVIAVVEDRAVLQSDLDLEYKRYLMQLQRSSMSPEEEREAKQQILDALVADLLMEVHAEKEGIEVADAEIDERVEAVIEENRQAFGGEEALQTQLEREGLTLAKLRATLREKIKARMLVERLMYREVMGEKRVTEGETRRYYREHVAELPKRPATVTIAHILLIPTASEEATANALAKIRLVEERLADGGDFAAIAREFSEDPSAPGGGSLGYVKLGDLNSPAFEEAAARLEVGQVSEPVLTQFGYHLIKVEDARGDERLLRHILAKAEATEEDADRTARLAEAVRDSIVAGADFAEMARRYSDDSSTKDTGGVVGEIAVENLPDFFREIIRDLDVGEIAPVIKEKKGFRIIKILDRASERDYTYEEAREELGKLIEQQERQERFQRYVEELKKVYHVELKEDGKR